MEESIGFCSVCGNASKLLRMIFHNNKWYCRECFYKMGTSVMPNKLKEELEDVKKVYDYGKTICTHPNSFDRLQTEIVKVCNVNKELEQENTILKKALYLYVNWADECDVAWDNFPDMTEKWYKVVEEKGLGWIDGLVFMVTEEAKEQLMKEQKIK